MSGIRNKHTGSRRGRPKRNNMSALQPSQSNETHLVTEPTGIDVIDLKQPLTINRIYLAPTLKQEHGPAGISDSNQKPTADAESSDLSSEDDTLLLNRLTTTPPVNHEMTHVQGVNLSRLPKVHFTSNSIGTDNMNKHNRSSSTSNSNNTHVGGGSSSSDDDEEEEMMYLQQQKAQEEHLLVQHYQMYQQSTPTSATHNNKELLELSRIFERPENHYIHYIEQSDVELYDSVEYDMDEQDKSWLKLYNGERRKDHLGDISPYLFECIMDKLEKEWFNVIKNAPKSEVEEVLLPEDSACAVCDDTEVENSNAIVFCDGCNVAVHQDCYGIPYIPEGQWLCRKCMISPEFPVSCIFCPNEGGAFKQTNTNQWGHLLCAIWIPEVGVRNAIYMEPIDQIENIPKSRWKLTCCICRKRQGACIQCDNKHCFAAFHVTCAKAAKLCMKMNTHQSQTEGVILKAYCDKHTPKEYCVSKNEDDEDLDSPVLLSSSTSNSCSSGSSSSSSSSDELVKGVTDVRRGRGRGRGASHGQSSICRQQGHFNDNKVARAHQHHYSTGAPIAPDVILAKVDNLPCVRLSSVRKRPELVTDIAHYWSLKRESRRGAPLLKRLHLEPWTATSNHTGSESDQFNRKMAIKQLRADLDVVRMLSEQVKKRERYKLEQTRRVKEYLEMIFTPLEYVLRPILEEFMEIDRKKLFLNHVTVQDAPDYRTVIKLPMCFSEICQKLNTHAYTEIQAFEHDVQLIWQNCMDYNAKDTSFYKVANKLRNASVKLFANAQSKMDRLELVDGMWNEPIDDALFAYDANYTEVEPEAPSQCQHQGPVSDMDPEQARLQKLERKRIKEQKEKDRQKAIEARVQGRARARALRKENRLKGIIAENPASQKAQLRTLQKLRTRKPLSTAADQQPQKADAMTRDRGQRTIPEIMGIMPMPMKTNVGIQDKQMESNIPHGIDVKSDCTYTNTLLAVEHEQEHHNRDNEIRALNIMDHQADNTAIPFSKETTAQFADMMDVDQSLITDNSYTETKPLEFTTDTFIPTHSDGVLSDTISLDNFLDVEDFNNHSPTSSLLEPKQEEPIKTIPAKHQRSSSNTPRLTRSSGLQASIEELTKRRKISHEARTLFASYNGVSHLEKPVEVYKENRKKPAPVGWVYLDVQSNEKEDEGTQLEDEDEEHEQDQEESLSVSCTSSKPKKPSRNDVPIPNFQKGEIVWAKVNRYPSHPAKFLNLSDEETDPKLVASRRYAGDILVEFLKVPPNHQFGWVGRRTICEIGDPKVDRERLSESLTTKGKRSMFIQEAKEGYRAAGDILGLDPEPLLTAVFDTPLPKKKKKRSHNKKSKA